MQPNQVLGIVLLKLDELSRQQFLCAFVCDRDCKGTNQKMSCVIKETVTWPNLQQTVLVCENWLLNLKDCEHEKRRASLAKFLCYR